MTPRPLSRKLELGRVVFVWLAIFLLVTSWWTGSLQLGIYACFMAIAATHTAVLVESEKRKERGE